MNIMQKDKVCYDSFLYMRKNALAEAWGTPWGEFVVGPLLTLSVALRRING